MEMLKALFTKLAFKYTEDLRLINQFWEEIEVGYSSPFRHYHNLNHLKYMLNKMTEYCGHLNDTGPIIFSIFYHDMVYDVKSSCNEEESASFAKNRLKEMKVPEAIIKKCEHQIISTNKHQLDDDSDTNFLIDFDLAILGKTPHKYKEYTQQIRKEYIIYPDAVYNSGRKKVIEHFLDMKNIFKTSEFQLTFEKQAKKNLKAEWLTL
ncbi:HD domain-containing protein [Fulvivirga sediminis]|uniref:Metal-dependent HD superfamily phosphohydrolase n=1 Tax=Fulvivirga sediminis TaxID=2803949 RepID=A0A937JXD3_9BACT|nr:hypothetical protein [Fulvivirga sediminis]MBL3654504.1 hypothetical protein [Fulvivirga sediminis]